MDSTYLEMKRLGLKSARNAMLLDVRNVHMMVFVLNAQQIMNFAILIAQVLMIRFMIMRDSENASLNAIIKINMKHQHLILDS